MIKKLLTLGSAMICIEIPPGVYPTMTIVMPSGSEEGVFEPAQSICLRGQKGLENLRDTLNECFPKNG